MAMSLSIVRRLIPSTRAASTLLKASASGARSGPGFFVSIVIPLIRIGCNVAFRYHLSPKPDVRRTSKPASLHRWPDLPRLWPRVARHTRLYAEPSTAGHIGPVLGCLRRCKLRSNRDLLPIAWHAAGMTLYSRAHRTGLDGRSWSLRGLCESLSLGLFLILIIDALT
jgi:hypothetical protein